jgi:hypothetical protein
MLSFIAQFRYSEEQKIASAKMGITGAAIKILRTVQASFQTLNELLNKLRRTYGESENRTEALEAICQEPEELARRLMGRLSAGLTLTG